MKFIYVILVLILTSLAAPPASAQTAGNKFDKKSEKKYEVRDLLGIPPALKEHVERAMSMFRAEETCSLSKSNRSKSKLCTEVLTYDKALAENEAELKACQAECAAGAATKAKTATKIAATDLSRCVDQSCRDQCEFTNRLFSLELDSYVKGFIGKGEYLNK